MTKRKKTKAGKVDPGSERSGARDWGQNGCGIGKLGGTQKGKKTSARPKPRLMVGVGIKGKEARG